MKKALLLLALLASCGEGKPPQPAAIPPPPVSVIEARSPAELEVESAKLKRDMQALRDALAEKQDQLNEERQTLANLRNMYAELQKTQHPVGIAIGKWFQTHDADHKAMHDWMSRMEAALERRARDESAREAKKALDNMKKVIDLFND
jgi:glutathione S-transferase